MDLKNLVDPNQSIKIVPSIEDVLRSSGYVVELQLDEFSERWLIQLKSMWKTWKKSPTVEQNIESFLTSQPNPYRVTLAIIIKLDEFKDCKSKTLPYYFVETLEKWSNKMNILPDESLKEVAFQVSIKQSNQQFLNLMAKTYRLHTIMDKVLPFVKEIIGRGDYKQARQIVVALQMFDEIPVEDLLFPLILQDKVNIIDEYLVESPQQVKQFLLFLDKLLDKSLNIRDFVHKYLEDHNVTHIKYEKLHYKPLGKLVARLCNKFKIPIDTCKNLSKNRTTGGLRYLVYQRYHENNVSSTVWDDLVKDSLTQNADSAAEFIDFLSMYDRKEALKWAEYLKIPKSEYPPVLRNYTAPSKADDSENWDTPVETKSPSKEFYKLSIPMENVILVDSPEKFYDMLTSKLTDSKIVSIDCEWKPSFGATQLQVALIQVATIDMVYLIDTLVLNDKKNLSFWLSFYKSVLNNAEIIKVGFGFEQDLREIKASVVGLNNISVKGEGLLDIAILWKSLLTLGLKLPSTDGNSLSSLVQSCFGCPLAKEEQCSNWELRPLRMSQIQYAAIDAHVLLDIYNYFQNQCSILGINFDEVCNNIMLEGKQKTTKKTKVIDRLQESLSSCSRLASQTKFLVDSKLSTLLPYFRYCGIDSIVIPTTMLWHNVISLAISEDRLILLAKIKYTPTSNYPQSSIFEVSKSSIKEQVQKIINHFNINLNEQLLSVCLYCNDKSLTRLSPMDVQKMFSETKQTQSVSADVNNYAECDNDNYDGFLDDSVDIEEIYHPVAHKPSVAITTSKGVNIEIRSAYGLQNQNKPAVLCESCGKMFWDNEDLLKSVSGLIHSATNLSFTQSSLNCVGTSSISR